MDRRNEHDPRLDLGRDLLGPAIRLGSAHGPERSAVVRIADEPSVQRAAVYRVSDGDLVDAEVPVDQLTDCLVALFNHRQLLQQGLPRDSA